MSNCESRVLNKPEILQYGHTLFGQVEPGFALKIFCPNLVGTDPPFIHFLRVQETSQAAELKFGFSTGSQDLLRVVFHLVKSRPFSHYERRLVPRPEG